MNQESESSNTNANGDSQTYVLRLYIAGVSINSVRALTNIKELCDKHLAGRYTLEIIDVHQQKMVAQQEQIIALPMLIKYLPQPERRLIGDMSDTALVLKGLGLV